jgi:hypothetical protein
MHRRPCRVRVIALPLVASLAAILVSLFVTVAKADQVAFSNFDADLSFSDSGGVTLSGAFSPGYEFNSATSGSVDEIELAVSCDHNGGTFPFTLSLYADDGGILGSQLWTGSVTPVSFVMVSGNPDVVTGITGANLTAGDNYWLVASASPGSGGEWNSNDIGDVGDTYDSGSYGPGTRGAFAVMTVPEPSTAVLGIAGLVLLVGARSAARRFA